jgi:hypothetical protein
MQNNGKISSQCNEKLSGSHTTNISRTSSIQKVFKKGRKKRKKEKERKWRGRKKTDQRRNRKETACDLDPNKIFDAKQRKAIEPVQRKAVGSYKETRM